MANKTQPAATQASGGQSCGEDMSGAARPAVIFNPDASKADLVWWAMEELQALREWVNLLACSKADVARDIDEIAAMVLHRMDPVIGGLEAAFEDGRA